MYMTMLERIHVTLQLNIAFLRICIGYYNVILRLVNSILICLLLLD